MTAPTHPVHFGKVPLWLIGEVSPRSIEVYALMWGTWVNHSDGAARTCWPSRRKIAASLHTRDDKPVNVRTVDRAIAELEQLGAIRKTERFRPTSRGWSRQTSNMYELAFEHPFRADAGGHEECHGGSDGNVAGGDDVNVAPTNDIDVTPELDEEESDPIELDQSERSGNREKKPQTAPEGWQSALPAPGDDRKRRADLRVERETIEHEFGLEFDSHFWPAYSQYKDSRALEARREFIRARRSTPLRTIMAGVESASRSGALAQDDPEYRPCAANWLRGERWEDGK